MKKITLVFLLFSICGCQELGEIVSGRDGSWIYSADPYDDFVNAMQSGDYRYLGIYGYSLSVPGISLDCVSLEKDVRPIEGTSDTNSSFEEAKFNALAKVYAEYYNFHVRHFLEEKGAFNCVEES